MSSLLNTHSWTKTWAKGQAISAVIPRILETGSERRAVTPMAINNHKVANKIQNESSYSHLTLPLQQVASNKYSSIPILPTTKEINKPMSKMAWSKTGFFLTIGCWALFSYNICLRKLTIVNSFSAPLSAYESSSKLFPVIQPRKCLSQGPGNCLLKFKHWRRYPMSQSLWRVGA